MALTQTRTTQPALGLRRRPALKPWLGFITVELVLLIATMALAVMVTVNPGPLPGDVGVSVWWQHLVRPHAALKAALDEVSAVNWPIYAAITLAAIVAILAALRWWLAILVLLGTEVADGANWLLNALVHRPRPSGYGVLVDRQITGYFSFPSGHVEHAVAILGLVLFLSFQVRRPGPVLSAVLWVVRLILLADIVLMAPARLLSGEHWPSDTLAALLFGAFWLLAGIQVYRWARRRWPHLLGAGQRAGVPPALPDAA